MAKKTKIKGTQAEVASLAVNDLVQGARKGVTLIVTEISGNGKHARIESDDSLVDVVEVTSLRVVGHREPALVTP